MSGRKINLEAARKRIAWLEAKIQNRRQDIAQLQEQLDFEREQLATMEPAKTTNPPQQET